MDDAQNIAENLQSMTLQSPAEPLIARCSALLEEIRALQNLAKQNYLSPIEIRAFRSNVQSELRFLKNIANQSRAPSDVPDDERTQHSLRSSNLGYFELVWAAAKASSGLVSIITHVPETGLRLSMKQEKSMKSIQVEIIAEDGLKWIKLNATSPKRLMYEVAKSGWEGPLELAKVNKGSAYDDSAHDDSGEEQEDEDKDAAEWNRAAINTIPLVQHAVLLSKAAKNTWIKFRHPTITYIFQNVPRKSSTAPIKQIIKRIQETGATVLCADDPEMPLSLVSPTIQEAMDTFKSRDFYANFTQRLNIDCTILLALASEISSSRVEPTSRRFNRAILSQLESEAIRPLLTTTLFPALAGHELFCTRTARQRFVEIVLEIGTAVERARAEILMGVRFGENGAEDVPIPDATSENLRTLFQGLCMHHVPDTLILPIKVIEEECFEGPKAWLPHVKKISDKLTPINKSVFMTGWDLGYTTITSNMAVGKLVEQEWTTVLDGLERTGQMPAEEQLGSTSIGPDLWILETARSLVGKGPKPQPIIADEEVEAVEGKSG